MTPDAAGPARFTIRARLKSFRYAFGGIGFMLRTQHNAWIHLVATLLVCAAGITLDVSADDWRWLIAAMVLVWVAEAMNTAFEHLCDVVSPEFNISVKCSKDVAAGAVLICSIGAVLLGALTLAPYLAR
jgi:diacylglycerol kinase (ATP)